MRRARFARTRRVRRKEVIIMAVVDKMWRNRILKSQTYDECEDMVWFGPEDADNTPPHTENRTYEFFVLCRQIGAIGSSSWVRFEMCGEDENDARDNLLATLRNDLEINAIFSESSFETMRHGVSQGGDKKWAF
jgi:hypothetical protein